MTKNNNIIEINKELLQKPSRDNRDKHLFVWVNDDEKAKLNTLKQKYHAKSYSEMIRRLILAIN
jgi:hypothetical protein